MKKIYRSSPLPFQGQKRLMLKNIKSALKQFPENAIFIDLFGGSGLVSHTIKQERPNSKVVYSDFDNFQKRLDNIPKTNALVDELRDIVSDYPREKQIKGELKDKVLQVVKKHAAFGFCDFRSLSSNLLYTMDYALNIEELEKASLYNNIRKSRYEATGYLDGCERVSMDYKQLMELYEKDPNVVFVADPPYLSTDKQSYKNGYWGLKDYLNIAQSLKKHSYMYFTSNKSQIIELCEWMEDQGTTTFLNGASTSTTSNKAVSFSYTDIMLYKVAV